MGPYSAAKMTIPAEKDRAMRRGLPVLISQKRGKAQSPARLDGRADKAGEDDLAHRSCVVPHILARDLHHRSPFLRRRPALRLLLPTPVFHFPRMLAEGRRWAPYRRSFVVHEHGRAEYLEHSGARVLHLPQHVRAREVLVGQRLGQGVDRTARNPGAPDPPDALVRGLVGKLAL